MLAINACCWAKSVSVELSWCCVLTARKETKSLLRHSLKVSKNKLSILISVLLIVMPDIPHVGKNLKGSFCNWRLTIGNERGNISLLRSLRNFSNREEKRIMIKFIPKNDDIRHRDRQNPHSVTTITNPPLTKYLSEIGYVCCTIIPERTKFTVNNQAGMCVSPTHICLGKHGYLYVLCDSGDDQPTGNVLRARLHSPVDDMTMVKKSVAVKEIQYWDSVVYMCGDGTDIM